MHAVAKIAESRPRPPAESRRKALLKLDVVRTRPGRVAALAARSALRERVVTKGCPPRVTGAGQHLGPIRLRPRNTLVWRGFEQAAGEVEPVESGLLLEEGKNLHQPRVRRTRPWVEITSPRDRARGDRCREQPTGLVVGHHGQAHLLEIRGAAQPAGRFPRRLHGRKQKPEEEPDDRHDHQNLNKAEAAPAATCHRATSRFARTASKQPIHARSTIADGQPCRPRRRMRRPLGVSLPGPRWPGRRSISAGNAGGP